MRWKPWRTIAILASILVLGELGQLQSQAPQPRQPVYLHLLLPQANAQVVIENVPTRQTGTTRTFVSPPLETGKIYTYTVATTWQPNNYTTITRTRQIDVRAGQEVEADLRQADDKNPDKIVVRYVPTPNEVVEAMLKLANVGKDDVVYDLGCGDGRLVITAVEKFQAQRGVGVDIDPERIKDSNANASKSGVRDKVEFRQGDVLEINDLADASVVMLYMGNDLNLRLRPILQKTLKPGSRIVSHRFLMGDWKPLKTETIIGPNGEKYQIHLWQVGEP